MTDYSITLPKRSDAPVLNLLQKKNDPELFIDGVLISSDVNIALSAFDTDGIKGLSSDELIAAFDYFVNQEKEIAITGKKGDNVLTSKDIEQIIKSDSKFSAIRENLKDDNKVVDLLSNIVMTLATLVTKLSDYTVTYIGTKGVDSVDKEGHVHKFKSNQFVTNTRSEIKEVYGTKVKICQNEKGENYVTTVNGEYKYYHPNFVAKCFGYQSLTTESGDTKYYKYPHGKGESLPPNFKKFKIWHEDTHSFTDQ